MVPRTSVIRESNEISWSHLSFWFRYVHGVDDTAIILDNATPYEVEAPQHRLNRLEPIGPQKKRQEQQRKAKIFAIEAHLVIYPLTDASFKKVCRE
jgi:hypothetical protein